MNSKNQTSKGEVQKFNAKKISIIAVGVVVVILIGVFAVKGAIGKNDTKVSKGGDLIIPKSEVTETAKFYPYNANGTKLEILAVKASDDTIRTAFNTCQICNGSPRAYYKQEGKELVCQNCGNRFSMDMVEKERGGCNPIPIMQEDKIDDGTNIIISEEFILKNKKLFTANWKTR